MAGQRKSKLTAAAEVRKGKKKKVVIIAVLAAAAALAAGVLIYQARQKRLAEEAMFQDEPSYEEVVRTDIERTYVSQGRIASLEEMVAGAQADEKSGYRVAEVFVKVGDAVHKGDPLYSLDLSSVEEEIRSQEEKLSLQQRSDAIDQSAAGRGTANAQAASSQTYYDETRALERQADDVNELIKKRDEAKEEFERLTEKEAVAKVWLDDAQAFYDATSGEGELCLPNLENAKANYIPIKADYDAAKSAYEAAEKALETAVRALEDLGSTVESGNRSALEAEASARDSAEKQRLSQQINAIDTQSELKKSYEKLENGTVYAKMDGTVTGVNVKPGELYSGQSAVTINDLASFKVTAEIDEGHIADLYVGMPVRVKTTSTGDEILEGVVSFASPTPTVEQAQASSQTQTQHLLFQHKSNLPRGDHIKTPERAAADRDEREHRVHSAAGGGCACRSERMSD